MQYEAAHTSAPDSAYEERMAVPETKAPVRSTKPAPGVMVTSPAIEPVTSNVTVSSEPVTP
eukprot:1955394-Rhodomonas_salina.1